MTNRIRTFVAVAVTAAALASIPSHASAASSPCVAFSEFVQLKGGMTKAHIETMWDVRGAGKWDATHSDPGHDAYFYPRCGRTVSNHKNVVRVIFARHTRVWTEATVKAHGTNLVVATSF